MRSRFLVVLALLVMASRADADDIYWSSIATACTPASVAIQDDRYSTTPDSTVAPKPGQFDPIVLICGVLQKQDALLPHALSMTYLDNTGAGASAKVQAQLIRVQRSNGTRAVVATVISNSFPQTTTAYHKSGLFSPPHVLNFSTYYYYVRIEIDRTASSESVRSLGVALESTCGDGVISAPEACDDGDTTSGDGCSATCTVEAGYACTGAPSVCSPICGNGVKTGAEACDDGNLASGDGCSATCTVEAGYSCTGSPSVCSPICGNGVKTGAEACDDGNLANGDGCSATCTVEAGYQCTGSPSVCSPICGNGVKTGAEACDDGNLASGDGCSATCTVEAGYQCTGSPSVCITTCGDGVIAGTETCDDGGTVSGDGCSATCMIEAGYTCEVGPPMVCTTTCGDSVVAGTETCDDGNAVSGDGCSETCTVEAAYQCTGSPSVCTLIPGMCLTPSDCPGTDSFCQQRTCSSNTCGVNNAPSSAVCAVGPPQLFCDGVGHCGP